MEDFTTRVSIIKVDDASYYIGLQFYHSHFDTWMTLKHISNHYSSYEEAAHTYQELDRLGYMDPALYSVELNR